jgi:predicted AAA+ superfamily ATPase
MDKKYLEQIVLDQKQRLSKLENGYSRDKLSEISNLIKPKINIVVTGHRRVGKSTFLLQWMNKYYSSDFYYLDFSDERLAGFETKDFQVLYEIFLENFGEKKVFFFDELQGKRYDWNKFVNRLYSEGKRFFITGSNAELLSKEISTYLTGRHFDISMYPFSFKEYLGYNSFNKNYKSTSGKVEAIKYFNKYIKEGGFPEVIVYGNKDILENIYQDVINTDILSRYNIKEEVEFKKMALFLIFNFSKEFSYTSLKNNYNLGSTHTAKKYVSYLTNTYLLFELTKYDYSLKKQENYSKKIYVIDPGLINQLAFAFSDNIGRLYENVVFIELLRRGKKVYFFKDKLDYEIDFITLEKNKIVSLIQVCYDLNDIKTKEREIRGLLSGLDEFKLKEGIIITRDLEKEEKIDDKIIKFTPLWKWLLE